MLYNSTRGYITQFYHGIELIIIIIITMENIEYTYIYLDGNDNNNVMFHTKR
jgi:hypothetical protein